MPRTRELQRVPVTEYDWLRRVVAAADAYLAEVDSPAPDLTERARCRGRLRTVLAERPDLIADLSR